MKDCARGIVLLKLTTDGYKASRSLCATAELLVIYRGRYLHQRRHIIATATAASVQHHYRYFVCLVCVIIMFHLYKASNC